MLTNQNWVTWPCGDRRFGTRNLVRRADRRSGVRRGTKARRNLAAGWRATAGSAAADWEARSQIGEATWMPSSAPPLVITNARAP